MQDQIALSGIRLGTELLVKMGKTRNILLETEEDTSRAIRESIPDFLTNAINLRDKLSAVLDDRRKAIEHFGTDSGIGILERKMTTLNRAISELQSLTDEKRLPTLWNLIGDARNSVNAILKIMDQEATPDPLSRREAA